MTEPPGQVRRPRDMRTAHSGPRLAPKRKMRAAKAAAASGLIVIAAGTLAACGAVSASSAPGAASQRHGVAASGRMIRVLCAQPRAVTALRVVRFGSRAQLGQTKALRRPVPAVTIKDPARVRQLAMDICKLPRMPGVAISCPADLGGGYVLQFSAHSNRFHAVTLRTSGCQVVSGTGPGRARWVSRKPVFWQQLAHLTGITPPAHTQG